MICRCWIVYVSLGIYTTMFFSSLLSFASLHCSFDCKQNKGYRKAHTNVVEVQSKIHFQLNIFDMQNVFCYPNDEIIWSLFARQPFSLLVVEMISFHSISPFTTKSTGSKTIRSFIQFYDLCTPFAWFTRRYSHHDAIGYTSQSHLITMRAHAIEQCKQHSIDYLPTSVCMWFMQLLHKKKHIYLSIYLVDQMKCGGDGDGNHQ